MSIWKKTQDEFASRLEKAYGKRVFIQRFSDTAVVKALVGKKAFLPRQPADFHIILDGDSFYAEVKSSQNDHSFPLSSIQTHQLGVARRVTAAGGRYYFFVKSESLNRWFRLPACFILDALSERKSLPWGAMESYQYAF